ncbi:MAG: hypothetical protein QXW84_06860, partial [Archaeoglobaceae archaeon]
LAEFNVEGKGNALVMDAVTVCAVPLNPMVELRLECRQNTLPPNWLAILSCCGVFYGAVISCAGICGASLGLLCAGCILTGIGGTAGTCWSVCSAMDLCGYSLVGLVKESNSWTLQHSRYLLLLLFTPQLYYSLFWVN